MAVALPCGGAAGQPGSRAPGQQADRATRWHGKAIAGVAADMKAVTGTRALAASGLAARDAAVERARDSGMPRQSA